MDQQTIGYKPTTNMNSRGLNVIFTAVSQEEFRRIFNVKIA